MIDNNIYRKISKSSKGEIFFANDFLKYGSSENIRQTLRRLEKEGILERISHGIYLKPKTDEELGMLYPSIEEVAHQIAQRDSAQIVPTGILALHRLGLTTQIPLKVSFLTDGSAREVKVGNNIIKFKRTVPKTFKVKNELLQLIIQSFKEIGQQNMSESFLQKIKEKVDQLPLDVFNQELLYAPVWIQKIIQQLKQSQNSNVD